MGLTVKPAYAFALYHAIANRAEPTFALLRSDLLLRRIRSGESKNLYFDRVGVLRDTVISAVLCMSPCSSDCLIPDTVGVRRTVSEDPESSRSRNSSKNCIVTVSFSRFPADCPHRTDCHRVFGPGTAGYSDIPAYSRIHITLLPGCGATWFHLLGGDRPSQTAHLTRSPARIHGSGLGSK